MPKPYVCGKCGSGRIQVTGQSVSPPAAFIECRDCGYSTLIARPRPPSSEIDKRRIERLVQTVIADFRLPCELMGVKDAPEGWQVAVKTAAGSSFRFVVKADALSIMRASVQHALTTEPT